MAARSQQPGIPGMSTPKLTTDEKRKYRQVWTREIQKLAERLETAQWELGDSLIEGRRHLSDAYDKAEEITGLARATLLDIKATAEWFDGSKPSRRREARLSWSHHKELKKLKKLEILLVELKERAVEKGWSVQSLRDEVKKKKPKDGKPHASLRKIAVEASLYARLEKAAALEGADIKTLVAAALSGYLGPQSEAAELEELLVQ